MTRDKLLTILLHAVIWIGFLGLPYLVSPMNIMPDQTLPANEEIIKLAPINPELKALQRPMPNGAEPVVYPIAPVRFWFEGVFIIFFYINAYYFIPKFLHKKKMFMFYFLVIISFVAFIGLFYAVENYLFKTPGVIFFPPVFPMVFMFILSSAYRLYIDRNKQIQLQREKENENLKTELKFLRSQISPHFIFNVLNSFVSLSRKRSDLIEPIVIKLSDFMRYMLYETSKTVPLSKEINYVQSYIDLQNLRFGDKVPVTFNVQGEADGYSIEPMLLIPLVENAFKHGIGMIRDPSIQISAKIQKDLLTFEVKNKYVNGYETAKDNSSGIGIQNLERRLKLLYPDKYEFIQKKDKEWFESTLNLKLI